MNREYGKTGVITRIDTDNDIFELDGEQYHIEEDYVGVALKHKFDTGDRVVVFTEEDYDLDENIVNYLRGIRLEGEHRHYGSPGGLYGEANGAGVSHTAMVVHVIDDGSYVLHEVGKCGTGIDEGSVASVNTAVIKTSDLINVPAADIGVHNGERVIASYNPVLGEVTGFMTNEPERTDDYILPRCFGYTNGW